MGLDGGTVISRSDVLRGASWDVSQRDTTRSTRGGSVATGQASTSDSAVKEAERVAAWTTCTLSGVGCAWDQLMLSACQDDACRPSMHAGQRLSEPVVADRLGRLYNKNAVVEYLLAKKHDVFVRYFLPSMMPHPSSTLALHCGPFAATDAPSLTKPLLALHHRWTANVRCTPLPTACGRTRRPLTTSKA